MAQKVVHVKDKKGRIRRVAIDDGRGGIDYPGMTGGGGGAPPIPRECCVPGIPARAALNKYAVNRPDWEAIYGSLYDSAAYAAAGQPTLQFFTAPQGSGTGLGGGVKTLTDTNMTVQGALPAGQEFLIEAIDISFYPDTPTPGGGANTTLPSQIGAPAVLSGINDAFIFYRGGNFVLTILAKPYVTDAPLMKFPPRRHFHLDAALSDSTSPAAAQNSRIGFAHAAGTVYNLKPKIYLVSNMNFQAVLAWPEGNAAIANPARVVCTMEGLLYRQSQ